MSLTANNVYRFENFSLDLGRGALLSAAQTELPLRPKAFALLCLLVENAGRLLDRDTIMAAVWPHVLVTEDSITQCVREIRTALGDDAQQTVRAVRGRGYILSATVLVSRARPAFVERGWDTSSEKALEPQCRVETGVALPIVAGRVDWLSDHGTLAAVDETGADPPACREVIRKDSRVVRPPRLSIVVLPFSNLSDDREQQFLADGITMDLTTELSRIRDALVISCNTAFTYRNNTVPTTQIARDLDVRFVLEGSVQRSGNRIRVNAQLIDGVTDTHIWADRFDGDIGDFTALQDDVVNRIAVELNLELIKSEAARPTERIDVLDCIMRSRALGWQGMSRDNYAQRIALFEQACALDDRSVEAMSRLALMLTGRALDQMTDCAAADVARAEELVAQALAISAHSPIAHYAKGHLLRSRRRDREAIVEYEVALASNRNWVAAIAFLGGSKLFVGSLDEVIPAQERAIRLSPRDPEIWVFHLFIEIVHLLRLRIDEAIPWLERSRTGNLAHALPNAWLASAYGFKGERERARYHLAEAIRLGDGRYASIARLKTVGHFGVPAVASLFERTFLAGLKTTGMPEV